MLRMPLAQTVEAFQKFRLTGRRTQDARGGLGEQIGQVKVKDRAAIRLAVPGRPLGGADFASIVFSVSHSARHSGHRLQFSLLPTR
jgi:hypothetical protein